MPKIYPLTASLFKWMLALRCRFDERFPLSDKLYQQSQKEIPMSQFSVDEITLSKEDKKKARSEIGKVLSKLHEARIELNNDNSKKTLTLLNDMLTDAQIVEVLNELNLKVPLLEPGFFLSGLFFKINVWNSNIVQAAGMMDAVNFIIAVADSYQLQGEVSILADTLRKAIDEELCKTQAAMQSNAYAI